MTGIANRLKRLRTELGITQAEFGERLGWTRSFYKNLEYGITEPRDNLLALMSREFGVSEKWLRTGEGEMFDRSNVSIDALVAQYGLGDLERALLENYLALPPELRQELMAWMKRSIAQHERQTAEQGESATPAHYEPLEFAADSGEQADKLALADSISERFPEED